jgi:hypothetical protein
MKCRRATLTVALTAVPITAWAQSTPANKAVAVQEPAPTPALAASGSAAIASDYRLRGVSQTDREMAVKGGFTVACKSGAYARIWGSNPAGWGTSGSRDCSPGADNTCRNVTRTVKHVDPDVSNWATTHLHASFSESQDGTGSIAGDTVATSLKTAF